MSQPEADWLNSLMMLMRRQPIFAAVAQLFSVAV